MPTLPVERLVAGVHENGDFLVFYVDSSRPAHEPHRVDLQKFCGNGDCDCEDFRIRLSQAEGTKTKRVMMLKGAIPHPSLECKHIRRAKRYLLQKVLNKLIEDRDKKANENKLQAKAGSTVAQRIQRPSGEVRPASNAVQTKTLGWSGGKTPFAKKPATRDDDKWGPPETDPLA